MEETWPGDWKTRTVLGGRMAFAAAQVQAKAAEVARIIATWQEPVAKSHRELPAGDDDDRHLPGH